MRQRLLLPAVLLAVLIAEPGPPAPRARRVPVGDWGGPRVAVSVEETQAHLEFDCAHGRIPRRLNVDGRGRFQAEGRYVAEHGGPVRADEADEGRPARYSGVLSGRTLTLTVRLAGGETLGPYTLGLGQPPRLMKCK